MKLRLQGDALRLRLSKAEVAQIAASGEVAGGMDFASGARLAYVLESSGAQEVSVDFEAGTLRVRVPDGEIQTWAETERVGIEALCPAGDGRFIQVLIEKDFACLHRNGEENAGTFPNPASPA